MTILHQLAEQGQSIWLDFIRRSFLDQGELADLVEKGLRGVTSNPSIFQKAIANGQEYDDDIRELVADRATVNDIYEHLAVADIRRACDILRPVYDRTQGQDGYVSLEVNPKLAYDTAGTIAEARRLRALVDRPNVMIKVPATVQGIPAIRSLIGEGISINVTLMFSLAHYDAVAEAYISGLEQLAESGGDLSRVASVASFFVSRVDGKVDAALAEQGNTDLQGQIAVANSQLAYGRFLQAFSGPRWQRLADQGAQVQRPLWASTSAKNPDYSPTLYVETLVGPHTVNTLPPNTLEAAMQAADFPRTVDQDLAGAQAKIDRLAGLGIDLDAITDQLQTEGVEAFAASFDELMKSIAAKAQSMSGRPANRLADQTRYHLGDHRPPVDEMLAMMDKYQVVAGIWAHSHTIWHSEPAEITNRLGWLDIAQRMRADRVCIDDLVAQVTGEGFTHAVVLGMGGSSLAPEVFAKLFPGQGLTVLVLDSTHPDAVAALLAQVDLARTLFMVSTKSGTTAETLSFFKSCFNATQAAAGEETVGQHFVAITDPGSKLVEIAKQYNFRATFLNDPNIGGRYSALSYFGLLPAALTGVDLGALLDRAVEAMNDCGAHLDASKNPGAIVGAIMGTLAKLGRDKLTVIASPALAAFGDWLEQLVAESTGKNGKGVVPVVGEQPAGPDAYGEDRLFVYLQLAGDETHSQTVEALIQAGHPVIHTRMDDLYDLSAQFFLWEFATAVAGAAMNIHPFDQPNVESAKVQARKMMSQFMDTGQLPQIQPTLTEGELALYGDVDAGSIAEALVSFLRHASPGSYVSLQAYINPSPQAQTALTRMQNQIRDHYGLATTLGFGPRFLHSTGQLHKGDGGRGLFIQFVDNPQQDMPIPDDAGKEYSSVPFSVLIDSQSLGDRQALLEEGRQVLRIHLGSAAVAQLERLIGAITPVAER